MNKLISLDSFQRLILTPLKLLIDSKQEKIDGKSLSTNDFTTLEKEKIASIPSPSLENAGFFLGVNDEGKYELMSNINPGEPVGPVSNIVTRVGSGKVYIKWNDPSDVITDGETVAEWGGTQLLRKAGSMPANEKDGTLVIDNTTRGRYSTSFFCDSGLTNGETYYYKFFPYTTEGIYTNSAENEFSAMPTAQVAGIDNWVVTNMSASTEAGNGKIKVAWTDPAATLTSDGVTLATWGSTTIVVKAGSYPINKNDANAAYSLKVTTRNQFAESPLVVSGLTNDTTYYIAFYPETTDGGICSNLSQRITGVANRITIGTNPSASGTLTYNGNTLSPTWNNYNTEQMTIGGTTSSINAGSYTATFTPKTDYRWSDGSTTAKNVTWSIGKAAGTLSVSPTSLILSSGTTSATFTVSRSGNGTISAVSSNTGVVTVSPANSTATGNVTFTVSGVNSTNGEATITISVAAGTNHTAPSNKTVSVAAIFSPMSGTSAMGGITYTNGLSGLDAATINTYSKAISNNSSITNTTTTVYLNYPPTYRKISIGDQVTIALNGVNYTFDVIGFNHDVLATSTAYGTTTATGKAGITFQMHDLYGTRYQMNSDNTNSGGWVKSKMRTSTMVTMKSYLPSAWQSVLKPITKTTGKGQGSSSVETSTDSCFLLAEFEVFGSTGTSASNEGYYYAYYRAGNSRVKYQNGEAYRWWLRSPSSASGGYFCRVYSNGNMDQYNATSEYGVAFAFCV